MVSFSCEACGDIVTKKKLDQHRNQCRGASFSCIDCGVHFHGTEYRDHTSCISEAQKVQGSMYKEKEKDNNKKTKHEKRKSVNWGTDLKDMRPLSAYVEDVPEGGDESQAMAVAVVDVPPKAPSPPPAASATSPHTAAESTEAVNVFDFLVTDDPQKEDAAPYNTVERAPSEPLVDTRMVEHPVYYGNGDYSQYSQQYSQFSNGHPHQHQYMQYGFSYGASPVPPSYARYDSWQNLGESQASQGAMAPPLVTPAPKEHRREKRDREKDKDKRVSVSDNSEKKRKRHQVEELDLSSAKRPSSRDQPMTDAPRDDRVLHSGLTGGLSKLVTDPEFYEDRIDSGPTPLISPIKRSRQDRSGDDEERKKEKADRRKSSYASYSLAKVDKRDDNRTNGRKVYIHDDKYGRLRSPDRERRYHDDTHHSHRRSRSADRKYHDDRHHDRHHRNGTTNGRERHVRESISSEDKPSRKHLRVIEYAADRDRPERPASVQPNATNQVVSYKTRADLFLSFIQKGPDSERGCSINKVLKRYHRERDTRGEQKEDDNKELWKLLRLRKNERGEIVLFL